MSENEGYEYLEDIALADVAFRAWAPDPAGLFRQSWNATLAALLDNPEELAKRSTHTIHLSDALLDMLLHSFLEELVYLKDAQGFLGRLASVAVKERSGTYVVDAVVAGEPIDPTRHQVAVDVKAVTMHRLSLTRDADAWKAVVVLDV